MSGSDKEAGVKGSVEKKQFADIPLRTGMKKDWSLVCFKRFGGVPCL